MACPLLSNIAALLSICSLLKFLGSLILEVVLPEKIVASALSKNIT